MKYIKTLCILILAAGLSGCQGAKQVEEPTELKKSMQTRQKPHTLSSNWETKTDISLLPGIISSVSKELGINLEQKDIKTGRYAYTGVSPSGIDVKIEAIALVKGRSVLIVSVMGKRDEFSIMKPLLEIISNSLRKAVRDQN